jgi:hypothetical protein
MHSLVFYCATVWETIADFAPILKQKIPVMNKFRISRAPKRVTSTLTISGGMAHSLNTACCCASGAAWVFRNGEFMKKIIVRIAIVVVVLIVVALLVVFFSLDSIVKKGVERVGPMITKVDVKLEAAVVSPFGGSAELKKFILGNPEGYKSPFAISVGDIKVGAQMGSIMSDTIVVNEMKIQNCEINFEGGLTQNNLTKIEDNINGSSAEAGNQPKPKNAPPQPGTSKSSKKFIVKDLLIEGTKLHAYLNIPALGQKDLSLTVPPIHLTDIGTKEGGVTAEQLAQEIMKPLLASVTTAVTEQASNLGGQLNGQLKNLGGSNTVNKIEKGIGNLFKKQ